MEAEGEAEPLESRLRLALELLMPVGARSSQHFAEGLAMLKRWYYRSNRVGEIFFRDAKAGWTLRRILNAATRAGRPSDSLGTSQETAQPAASTK